jgi:hypothetical protein
MDGRRAFGRAMKSAVKGAFMTASYLRVVSGFCRSAALAPARQ